MSSSSNANDDKITAKLNWYKNNTHTITSPTELDTSTKQSSKSDKSESTTTKQPSRKKKNRTTLNGMDTMAAQLESYIDNNHINETHTSDDNKIRSTTWECNKCTFINNEDSDDPDKCMMCQNPRVSRKDPTEEYYIRETNEPNDTTDAVRDSIASDAAVKFTLPQNEDDDYDSSSVRYTDLTNGGDISQQKRGSMSRLGNMSFAAWEENRTHWVCNACTFVNEPRFLMCGACGMAESSVAIDDELISQGLRRMSLGQAQEFLINTIHKQLSKEEEDDIRHQRAVELLSTSISDEPSHDEQMQSSETAKAREHIETLERIQKAEREEHCDMLFTLEQWKLELEPDKNKEQQEQVKKQEMQLDCLMMEWREREKELQKLRKRLETNSRVRV